jgi:predicted small integral membrane protein
MTAIRRRWPVPLVGVLAAYALAVVALAYTPPLKDGAPDWFAPLIPGGWMAWSFPSAVFFLSILAILALMAVWEYARPGGHPRFGILRFETTRGDRLFLSLLGSAFICLGFVGLGGEDANLWVGLAACLVYALFVFRFV